MVGAPLARQRGRSRGLKIADDLGKQGHNGLTFVPGLGVGHNEHGSNLAPVANFRGLALPAPGRQNILALTSRGQATNPQTSPIQGR